MGIKRLWRTLKQTPLKNVCYVLLFALSVLLITGLNLSSHSYLSTLEDYYRSNKVETGNFSTYSPLTNTQLKRLDNKYGVTIEAYESIDTKLDKTLNLNEPTIRIINCNRQINQLAILEGRAPVSTFEVVIDPKFAAVQNYHLGDTLTLLSCQFEIVGLGITPDYTYTLKNPSDFMVTPLKFGVAYVNEHGYEKVKATSSIYSYSFIEQDSPQVEDLKNYLEDKASLVNFTLSKDNSRTETVFNDAKMPMELGLTIGTLLVIIITFIMSISIKNTISSESQTIGVLYAQGFSQKELLMDYLPLPLLLASLGIVIGYIIGSIIARPLLIIQEQQYTIPYVVLKATPYLIFVSIILPFGLTLIISYYSISKALNQTPLSLLRGQHGTSQVSKFEKRFTFKSFPFLTRFRFKSLIRERASVTILLFGALLSLVVLFIGFLFKDSCASFSTGLAGEIPYEYLYSFTNPEALNRYSSQGEQIQIKTIKYDTGKALKNITIQGVKTDTRFFTDLDLEALEENEVYITSSLQLKYNIQIGDTLTLYDETEDKDYTVFIKAIAPNYDYGQYLFTSTKGFNQILKLRTLTYSALITDYALVLPEHLDYIKSSKAEIASALDPFLGIMATLTSLIISIGVGILITVIFLLLKMTIDKSQINISMVKIFGYTPKEVKKLYLKGYFIFLCIGFIGAMPLSFLLCKSFFDSICESLDYYFVPSLSLISIGFAFLLMFASFTVSKFFLVKNINKIPLTEALKNRE